MDTNRGLAPRERMDPLSVRRILHYLLCRLTALGFLKTKEERFDDRT